MDRELSEIERRKQLGEALDAVIKLNPFCDIDDPVEWQREIRADRPLVGRAEEPKTFDDERSQQLYDALNGLAAQQTPETIQAWMEHLEDLRKDKPLFGREED